MDADQRLPADLARETEDLRRIARGVLFEPALAEDAVQDAWLAALRVSRNDVRGGWLGETVKRLARGIRRREARISVRERSAARDELQVSAADTAERIEILRTLLGALEGLDEPYRTAVRLRLLDDLPPREISERLNVPVETVRTHVRRGIERMRAKLDAEHRGRRNAFLGALVPVIGVDSVHAGLAAHAGVGLGKLGSVLVSTKLKWIAALTVIAALGTWWSLRSSNESAPHADERTVGGADHDSVVLAAAASGRGELHAPAPILDVAETRTANLPTAAAGAWRVAGRTTLGREAAFGGAKLGLAVRRGYDGTGEVLVERELVSDEHGAFAIELERPTFGVTLTLQGKTDGHVAYASTRFVPPDAAVPDDLALAFYPLDVRVRGRVLDAADEPIVGAKVRGMRDDSLTDEEGAFEVVVSTLRTPETIEARAEGYAARSVALGLVAAGVIEGVVLRLDIGARLHGRVVDDRERAVSGAEIETSFPRHAEVVSDAEGRFELTEAPADSGRFWISARADDGRRTWRTFQGSELPTDEIVLVLDRGCDVVGRVLDEQDAPVAAASIAIDENWPYDTRAVSDDDGRFVVHGVSAREKLISVARDGFAPHEGTLEFTADGGCAPLTIVLGRGSDIRGHVRDAEGHPLAGVNVCLRIHDLPAYDERTVTADDGGFELHNVPHADRIEAEAYAKGWVRETQQVRGDPTSVSIVMQRSAGLAGRVVDASTGKPVTRFRVRLAQPELQPGDVGLSSYPGEWYEPGLDFEDADGRWNTAKEDLEPNRVVGVEVRAPGYGTVVLSRVATAIDPESDMLVTELGPEVVVTGRVVDRTSGHPLAGARVRTFSAREQLVLTEASRLPQAVTDAAGEFRLEQMPNELVSLYVEADEHATLIDGPFEPARTASRGVIALSSGATLRGRLLDVAGNPRVGEPIRLESAYVEGAPHRSWDRTTDTHGAFEVRGLPPGEYSAMRMLPRGQGAFFELDRNVRVVDDSDVTVELRPQGSLRLRGTLTGAVEIPVEFSVTAWNIATRERRVAFAIDGRFEFEGMEAGRWQLDAAWFARIDEDELTGRANVELTAGVDGDVQVELQWLRR